MTDGIPELIEVWKIARHVGWPTKKMAQYLLDIGVVTQAAPRKDRRVLRSEFATTLPKLYASYVADYKAGNITSGRGKRPRTVKNSKEQ
jgi:hypothetical protein